MIVDMCRVRILGPARDQPAVVRALQDFARLQILARPSEPRVDPAARREEELLRRILADIEAAESEMEPALTSVEPARLNAPDVLRFARLGRNARRTLEKLDARVAAAEDERALLTKYRALFATFGPILERQAHWPDIAAYHVVLERPDRSAMARLREGLGALVGEALHLREQPLATGEVAILILLPRARAAPVERALSTARVHEIPLPEAYRSGSPAEAILRMSARLREIPAELHAAAEERVRFSGLHGPSLGRARMAIVDRLAALEATRLTTWTPHAFVIEGWLPTRSRGALVEHVCAAVGKTIAIEVVPREMWGEDEPPVAIENPRALRPFEALVRALPLPRYGSFDPTPFVALFFPLFFGFMLGDVGYGALLLGLALVLRARARPESVGRAIGTVACVCGAFGIAFGFFFGELFGDLGHRVLGLNPLLVHRGEKIELLLGVAVVIGLVHVMLGLVLGAVSAARRDLRRGIARAISAGMVAITTTAVLAAADVLPRAWLVGSLAALVAGMVALIATAGIVGPVELISTLCNVLSYARLMALGTASVTLALVANELAAAAGSLVAGIAVAFLLHFVNFVLGVFSPTIHALRLHYVEFFGKFFEPGGARYRPFAHAPLQMSGAAEG